MQEESQRQRKVAKLIQKELGDIFLRQASSWFGGAFITITHVRMTADLGTAYVYVSFLNKASKEEQTMLVEDKARQIKQELVSRIRSQLRHMPNLEFFLDDLPEENAKVQALFNDIDIPSEEEAQRQQEALRKTYKRIDKNL